MSQFWTLSVVFLALYSSLAEGKGKKERTLEGEFEFYSKCNGATMGFSPDWVLTAGRAATQCMGYENDACFKLCVVHNYDAKDLMTKKHNLNYPVMKKMLKDVDYGDKKSNREVMIGLLDYMEESCTKGKKFPKPEPGDDCTHFRDLRDCYDKEFKKVCSQ